MSSRPISSFFPIPKKVRMNTESDYSCSNVFPNDPSSSVHSHKLVEQSMSTPSSCKETVFLNDPSSSVHSDKPVEQSMSTPSSCKETVFLNDPSSSVHSDKSVEQIMSTPSSFKESEIEFEDDPAAFSQIKVLTPDLIDYFFKKGPSQPSSNDLPNKIFPKDIHGRCFHENWYWKNSPSGELSRRKWLSYSKKLDKIFCHYCAIFGKNEQINWSREGFSNWKNASARIVVHETSEAHIMASLKAIYREAAFPLIPSLTEKSAMIVIQNKEIVDHLIDITLFLGRHCLSFRGHREGWKDEIRGNFKDLAILMAKYSPPLAMHINEIQNYGRKTQNFLSWQRQNQLIQAISTNIKNVIQQELFNAHYFSISLDSTFDISKKEQLSMVIRYINKKTGIVCERLIAVRQAISTTGKHLFTMFEEICGELNLNWKVFLVGQSFDGAASMRGQYNGLQSFIKEQNQCATYVWCWAHRFNLVIVDAVSCCIEARDLFGNLEMLYDFIGSSKHRVNLYSSYQKKNYPGKPLRQLKRVETTRWSSHASALQTTFDTFDAIIDTLHSLESDDASHRVCSVKANGLMEYLLSERFILTGMLFIKIFDMTSPLSKFLQKKNIDLLAAVNYVQNILTRIKNLRNDIKFGNLIDQKN
ncbi:hypothetical protein ACI65C_013465 [Semiaphis heraclei]